MTEHFIPGLPIPNGFNFDIKDGQVVGMVVTTTPEVLAFCRNILDNHMRSLSKKRAPTPQDDDEACDGCVL